MLSPSQTADDIPAMPGEAGSEGGAGAGSLRDSPPR